MIGDHLGSAPRMSCLKSSRLYTLYNLYCLHLLPTVRVGKLSPLSVSNCKELLGNVFFTM